MQREREREGKLFCLIKKNNFFFSILHNVISTAGCFSSAGHFYSYVVLKSAFI